MIHRSATSWRKAQDSATRDTDLGMHVADLPSKELAAGGTIIFTIYWPEQAKWEGTDYSVGISKA